MEGRIFEGKLFLSAHATADVKKGRVAMDTEKAMKKPEVTGPYEKLITRFCKWAENRADIRAAVVIGSRARVDHPADEWADLDTVIVTTDPEYYVSSSDWINNFGRPLLTFIEPTSTGDQKERRVLYERMLDVDFAIFPLEEIRRLIEAGRTDPRIAAQLSNALGRGIRVLIDKDGITNQLNSLIARIEKKGTLSRPSQEEFLELVNDFIYHAVFTAKHLRRGELWWTVTCLNCHMQHLLLRMIEWHALATHDRKYDTWFRGRFLEEWAHPKAVKALHDSFAHYDSKDVKRALLKVMGLFRLLANETASKLNYPYPEKTDDNVTRWIRKRMSETGKSRN